jgi:hypothetical protein
MKPVEPSLHTDSEIISLPFEGALSMEHLRAEAAKPGAVGRSSKAMLQQLLALKAHGQQPSKSYPYPVQVWRLGSQQLWIALGGEVVVDYALSLKAKYGPATWVFGYSNDVMAYIPSSRVWKEGGYESGAFWVYGIPAERWCSDIERRITAAVGELVARSGVAPTGSSSKSPRGTVGIISE